MKKINFKKIIGYFIGNNNADSEIKIVRDWKIVVITFFAILILFFAVDIKKITDYKKNMVADINSLQGDSLLKIKKEDIESVFNEIQAREKRFNDALKMTKIKDPSR